MRSPNLHPQYLLLVCSIFFYTGAHSLALPRISVTIPTPRTSDKPTKYVVAIVCAALGGALLLGALAYALYIIFSRKKKREEDVRMGMERRPTLAAFTFGPRRGTVFGGLVRRGTGMEMTKGEGDELLGEMEGVSPLTPMGVDGLGGSGEKEKVKM